MPIDQSNALVSITLEGLFVICKNDRLSPPRWEIGVPNVPDGDCPHNFTINIFKITGSGTPVPVIPSGLATDRNIEITTNSSKPLSVEYFLGQGPFNGAANPDQGDLHDHRWLVDLESRKFHSGGVEARADVAKHYKMKIFIDGGQLYTLHKTVERYKRFRNAEDVLILGKLALSAGVDLPRSAMAGYLANVQNEGASQPAALLNQAIGVRYEVVLKHVCTSSVLRAGTDFDLYYEILRAKDGTRFQILTETATIPTDTADPSVRGGDEPQVCNPTLLGQSTQLPGV